MTNYLFISTKYRRNSKLALFTFIFAFCVILLGAYTRLTDAGLSCPDWPNCYGYITAPHTPDQLAGAQVAYPAHPVDVKKAWTEMTHRYFAGTEGILILILAGTLLFSRQTKSTKAKLIAVLLLGLLGVQVMLGMLTVTEQLHPLIVTLHLVTGLSILSVLWWAYLDLHLNDDSFLTPLSPRVLPFFWLAFIIVALQITLGGWISTHNAGFVCTDFPYCNGQLFPALNFSAFNTDLFTIHMSHRYGAYLTAIYIGLFSLFLLTKSAFRGFGLLLIALICLQLTLGVLNVTLWRPVWVALMHHAVAIIILLTVIASLIKASYSVGKRYVTNWTA